MTPAKIPAHDGIQAVTVWRALGEGSPREHLATAVRYTLQLLAQQHPGKAVEVRVPPYGAVQCLAGPRHTRGTPANVIEMPPEVWLALALGDDSWESALESHRVTASGSRASLAGMLPLTAIHQ